MVLRPPILNIVLTGGGALGDCPQVRALVGALARGDRILSTGLILQELLQGFSGPKDRSQLKLPQRAYDTDLDNIGSILDDVCDVINETGKGKPAAVRARPRLSDTSRDL